MSDPIKHQDVKQSYASTKPRYESDSIIIGCGVVAVIVLFLTIVGIITIMVTE